jgi:rubredoxin
MTNGEKLEQVFPDGICPFSKSWLDYEYKEPSTKVNQDLTKNKSEIPTSSDLSSGTRKNSEKLEKGTTKNDLGVDAVSRQAINGYIDYILSHGMGKKKSFDFIKKFVANMPPATPIRPKGQWIKQNDDYFNWYECSECGYGSEGEMQYSSEYDVRTSYCPNCGADMREVEE